MNLFIFEKLPQWWNFVDHVRCWRLIQAGSSDTCLQNDAFQTQFLWGELFELTFKGVLRIDWVHPTPTNSYHQDYDMFSNKQATLINLRLATVTRWKIDPMDWIGTTNKYWRFMKVHVPVSRNVKWMNLYTYRVYKLGPENMFRLIVFFVFTSPKLQQDL